jgi:cytosine/adenosine deaminase-related metal-dependent hydrolase
LRIITAKWVLTCDDDFEIIEDGAVVFDEKIIDVGKTKDIKNRYKDADVIKTNSNSVIMPGLINSHVHLEFSANKTTLKYGDFIEWLYSVIKNREDLIQKADLEMIDSKIALMLKSGTTTIGAISSYGADLEPCVDSKMNVVYFNEVIGSKPDMVDTLFDDFKARLKNAKENSTNSFIPGVAIHSPYSVHPFLLREVLKIAKNEDLSVTAHFLESTHEKEWLENSTGKFKPFFEDFLNQKTSLTTPMEFLDSFKDLKKLSFTHCTKAEQQEFKKIKELNGSIIHCPVSNRLLNNSKLDLNNIENINLSLGTDGLSSNYSLDLFDELKNALFLHTEINIQKLSSQLLKAATNGGAKVLGLDKGILKKEFDADIIAFELADKIEDIKDIAMFTILNKKPIEKIYIKGSEL